MSNTTGPHSLLLTSPNLPPVSETEAKVWYYGLPSRPKLIARTGSVLFALLPSFDAGYPDYPETKEIRIVGEHKIQDVWEDGLASKIHALLDEKQVDWTSTDVVRIAAVERWKDLRSSVVLWIGVVPESLSYERGVDVALRCQRVLVDDYGIEDVDVEIRTSSVVKAADARPRLFEPASCREDNEKRLEVMEPLAYTLGIQICGRDTQEVEGTAGFFLNEKGEGDGGRLLLVTARHVVLPDLDDDEGFEHKEDPEERKQCDVLVLNDASFKKHVAAVEQAIWLRDRSVDYSKRDLASMLNETGERAEERRKATQKEGEQAEKAADLLTDYRVEVLQHWAISEDNRVLGHVIYSPPMDVDPTSGYARDVAVIAVDPDKVDPASFPGNMIDLGGEHSRIDLRLMMPRNPKNVHPFSILFSRQLGLRGIVPDEEMRNPVDYDEDGNPCIAVLMRGATSGFKIGHANSIFSYTRDDKGRVSKQWPILPIPKAKLRNNSYDHLRTTFGKVGDSGAVVVDAVGRVGGIVACGAGDRKCEFDLTYVTPVGAVLDFVKTGKGLEGVKMREGPDEKTLEEQFFRKR
ncbi:uncharacterized protein LACBIDRAFT_321527 [Laccaria bicolor S238N-H82]|uniref:Predicted protein n=1 Tax=Laccaria bicolor (strain S238N-H82 / ATCC MYA-4686) TaxID=486041 RepID=B0CT97_LACBS|nr:uncharacterized protein LACBIDRAFT_321527 [Laccaria bicolor S238N-H82]EDR14456.1 predicted protein [Laccaria bicolor S238N-H82]|eukprot:XP_001875015.1 predicted protein [Laccaria bicolor S238N-H82]